MFLSLGGKKSNQLVVDDDDENPGFHTFKLTLTVRSENGGGETNRNLIFPRGSMYRGELVLLQGV